MLSIDQLKQVEVSANEYLLFMTAQIQEELGQVEFVDLAPIGPIQKDQMFMSIEAAKAAVEIPSDFDGEILAVNEQAMLEPQLLNSTNEDDCWIARIKRK